MILIERKKSMRSNFTLMFAIFFEKSERKKIKYKIVDWSIRKNTNCKNTWKTSQEIAINFLKLIFIIAIFFRIPFCFCLLIVQRQLFLFSKKIERKGDKKKKKRIETKTNDIQNSMEIYSARIQMAIGTMAIKCIFLWWVMSREYKNKTINCLSSFSLGEWVTHDKNKTKKIKKSQIHNDAILILSV